MRCAMSLLLGVRMQQKATDLYQKLDTLLETLSQDNTDGILDGFSDEPFPQIPP